MTLKAEPKIDNYDHLTAISVVLEKCKMPTDIFSCGTIHKFIKVIKNLTSL